MDVILVSLFIRPIDFICNFEHVASGFVKDTWCWKSTPTLRK